MPMRRSLEAWGSVLGGGSAPPGRSWQFPGGGADPPSSWSLLLGGGSAHVLNFTPLPPCERHLSALEVPPHRRFCRDLRWLCALRVPGSCVKKKS